MDTCPATDAVTVNHLPVEDTDDSCKVDFTEIVPFNKDTADFVKQEPDDVCCVIYFITAGGGREI